MSKYYKFFYSVTHDLMFADSVKAQPLLTLTLTINTVVQEVLVLTQPMQELNRSTHKGLWVALVHQQLIQVLKDSMLVQAESAEALVCQVVKLTTYPVADT